MKFDRAVFMNAAEAAGIKGKDHRDNPAIDDFSHYLHDKYDKWEREGFGYEGIVPIAKQWWADNRHKYSC